MRRLVVLLLALVLATGALLAFRPSPVASRGYRPPAGPPLEGPLAPNRELAAVELLGAGRLAGPEDVELDGLGRVYCGLGDGTVRRLVPAAGGWRIEPFADTGGRPLGLDFDRHGTLWVADAHRGLVAVDPGGASAVRASAADGVPFGFADDVDVAPDGRVYFTDASARLGIEQVHLATFEDPPSGRLLELDPATNSLRVLLDGLHFANGVAVAPDGGFVLVAETFRYRVRRYWLAGPRQGQSEIFADNLPGFPDGVSSDGRGGFWVALYTVRHELLDRVLHPRAWLKHVVARLPAALQPGARRYALALALDGDGRVARSLHDPGGERLPNVTSVEEWDGVLYLGSITGRAVGRYPLEGGN